MVVVNNCFLLFGDIIKLCGFGELILLICVNDVCVMIVSVFLLGDRNLVSLLFIPDDVPVDTTPPVDAQTTRVIAGCFTGEFVIDDDAACDVTGFGVRFIIKSDYMEFLFIDDDKQTLIDEERYIKKLIIPFIYPLYYL